MRLGAAISLLAPAELETADDASILIRIKIRGYVMMVGNGENATILHHPALTFSIHCILLFISNMVYAFIIHTVGSKEVAIPYYKVFTCYKVDSKTSDENVELSDSNFETPSSKTLDQKISSVIFESVSEKKELLQLVANKVHMHYCLRINQALIPVSTVENNRKVTGVFTERQLKHRGLEIVVVWQGVRGFGFTLLCSKDESILQAQATLDSIITQLESLLKFLSDPGVAIKLVETISLVTNNFIPGGLLIFANGKMNKSLIKKLEVDLYAK